MIEKGVPPLALYLARLIGERMMPDLSGHGFKMGWANVLYYTMETDMMYYWGYVILGQLYHDIHMYVYRGYTNLRTSVTLLRVCAWEHIVVLHPIGG